MPSTVLFTGFPGFIGARLLPRLLELQPDVRLRCLVQQRFQDAARDQVASIEAAHPHTRGRIGLVEGDITQPGLGIADAEARALQKDAVAAWHLAAVYDLAVSREVGHRINVEGTRNVLSFVAGWRRFERLHYVSTAYVSGRASPVFRETDLDVGQAFKNHYEETKFLAEVEVVYSGVPTTTYRPAIVVGDSRTGETGKFDGPYFILNAMERLPSPGVFMRIGSGRQPANLVPVDFVIEALARLGSSDRSRGRTYHLTDPEPLSVLDVGGLLAKALGKSFLFAPVPGFVARALFTPRAVQRFFGVPVEVLDYFEHDCRYDTTQASQDLGELGVRCPRFADYVERLVAFYRAHRGDVRRTAMI
jgi:nucleoside-diphosphate-sugar epimerase